MKQVTTLKLTAIILFLAMGIALNAQEKSEFKTKLDQLKGKIDKVTVNVDGKDVVFEGKDAEKLVKIVKPMDGKNMMWFSNDSEEMDAEGTCNTMMFHIKDDVDEAKGEGKKKIQIEIKDGKKNVTVTTTDKEGKEEVKKYEGEEAEKFIKDHEAGNGMIHKRVKVISDGDGEEDCNMVVFNKKMASMHGSECGSCCCCGGGKKMMHMPGMGKHKIMMKTMNCDDEEDVIIEKKIQKKHELKTEKKEMKKEEKK